MPDKGIAVVSKRSPVEAARERVNQVISIDPRVDIILRGVVHSLEFTNRAIINILRETGVNLLVDNFGDKGEYLKDPVKLSHFLHQALLGDWPELTYEQSLELYSTRHTVYIWSKLGEAISYIQPAPADVEAPEPLAARVDETPTKGQIVNGADTTASLKY